MPRFSISASTSAACCIAKPSAAPFAPMLDLYEGQLEGTTDGRSTNRQTRAIRCLRYTLPTTGEGFDRSRISGRPQRDGSGVAEACGRRRPSFRRLFLNPYSNPMALGMSDIASDGIRNPADNRQPSALYLCRLTIRRDPRVRQLIQLAVTQTDAIASSIEGEANVRLLFGYNGMGLPTENVIGLIRTSRVRASERC
jgi:hypothetical protein